jgi:two-component system chemotaxis response regulator CheB
MKKTGNFISHPIRVLVVDDSATARETLVGILKSDPDIEIMGTAADPYAAARRISEEVPHVIILDIEMPQMDGITFLKKIMHQHPIPVVICSSLTQEGSELALMALDCGAVDVINKPLVGSRSFLEESGIRICDAIKAAALTRPLRQQSVRRDLRKLTADVILPKPVHGRNLPSTERVIAVGASTGGTEAIQLLLESLPGNCPGIVIVQHMPAAFTGAFAKRLDSLSSLQVKEAVNYDALLPGTALIAPGDQHMILRRNGLRYYVEIKKGPLVCRHRPSVDVLFRSVAQAAGCNAIGVIMTGMGDDGALGMKEMHDGGGWTIAQDESTSVVFGMPREAVLKGGVKVVAPLSTISHELLKACS